VARDGKLGIAHSTLSGTDGAQISAPFLVV
jgi:hypothetical protein